MLWMEEGLEWEALVGKERGEETREGKPRETAKIKGHLSTAEIYLIQQNFLKYTQT